jgi:regulator of replication initiation timing
MTNSYLENKYTESLHKACLKLEAENDGLIAENTALKAENNELAQTAAELTKKVHELKVANIRLSSPSLSTKNEELKVENLKLRTTFGKIYDLLLSEDESWDY